jgi:hypothetical protein
LPNCNITDWDFEGKDWVAHAFDFRNISQKNHNCPINYLKMVLKHEKEWYVEYNESKTNEMRQSAPDDYKNKHCCFAHLKKEVSSLESTIVGKIGSSKKEAKKLCAIALLKHLDSPYFTKGLPELSDMLLKSNKNMKHLHVFKFICSVEFSLRGGFKYICNSVNFDAFLREIGLYDNVIEMHNLWLLLESKEITFDLI